MIRCLIDFFEQNSLNVNINNTIWDYIVDICAIITPFVILFLGNRFSESINKKNDEDNRVKRIATFNSQINLGTISELKLHLDSMHNYNEILNRKPVLLKEEQTTSDILYGFDLKLHFKNMTNFFPNKIKMMSIQLYDTDNDKTKFISNNIIYSGYNLCNKYYDFPINEDGESCIEVLCCCSKDDLEELSKLNKNNKLINLRAELYIRNSFNILTQINTRGIFTIENVEKISRGAIGSNKKILYLKAKETYTNINEIKEVINNE